jgi:hypothetical protein
MKMFCRNCSGSIPDGTVFCPECGQKQPQVSDSTAPPAQPYQQPSGRVIAQPPQAPAHQAYPAAKPKKKHGCLTAFLIVLAVIVIGGAAVYLLLPGLSRPVDLGIRSSREAYDSAMEKLEITKDKSPVSGTADDYTITYGAPHDVDTSLTSEELTSFFNENRPPYYAVQNVQVRVNDDGSVEASATLDTGYVFNQMLGGQYSKKDAQSALPMLGLIPEKVNIYFKVQGGVRDNQIEELSVDTVSVMGIQIPQSLIGDNMSFITNTLDSYIANECGSVGAYISSIEAGNGIIDIKGSVPSSVERSPAG